MQYNECMRCAAWFTLMACMVIVPLATATAGGPTAAEAAVLQSDAAWAAAADTGNVDAWLAFCSADVIVILPHEPLSNGVAPVRNAVTRLTGLPHFVVRWHATRIDMAPAGDLARVLGSYELEHAGADGGPAVERGTRLDVWKRQADGSWKSILDSWSSTTDAGDPAAAVATSAATVPATAVPAVATRYGDAPVHYLEAIRLYFQEHLKDPESLQYGQLTMPEQGYQKGTSGTFLMSESRDYGWIVKASVNARNADGRFVGFKTYVFLFRGEKLLRASAPLPEGEAN